MRKQFMVAAACIALALSTGAANAHEKGDESEQTVIQSRKFTIAKGQCSQLPANLEVKGVGLERTKTVVGEDESGVTYSLSSTITGTATDNFDGKYTFRYQLRLKKPIPLPGVGIVIDTFQLTGTGAANGMSTFFRVRVTFDAGANPTDFVILEQSGNPFGGCDPL
jgi:hypothetical protein